AVNLLHAEAFGHRPCADDWHAQVHAHSLGWVCARLRQDLVGFVNLAWDGALHAFVLDTMVAVPQRRRGIALKMLKICEQRAREAGCEWLHVDFDAELAGLYLCAAGFSSTPAGVLRLK